MKDAIFDQLGVALNVVPVVFIERIAVEDAGDLLHDDSESLFHVRGKKLPSSGIGGFEGIL